MGEGSIHSGTLRLEEGSVQTDRKTLRQGEGSVQTGAAER